MTVNKVARNTDKSAQLRDLLPFTRILDEPWVEVEARLCRSNLSPASLFQRCYGFGAISFALLSHTMTAVLWLKVPLIAAESRATG